MESVSAGLRVRISQTDCHYGGNLVSGSKLMEFFGDVATEILIRTDGDEGLFRAYDNVEFLAPVYAGDYLEIKGSLTKKGNTSRVMQFEVWKVIEPEPKVSASAARVLNPPVLVARASGTCVVPKECQRNK